MPHAPPPLGILLVEPDLDLHGLLSVLLLHDFAPCRLYQATTLADAQRLRAAHPVQLLVLNPALAGAVGEATVRALLEGAPPLTLVLVQAGPWPPAATEADGVVRALAAYKAGAYDPLRLLAQLHRAQHLETLLRQIRGAEDEESCPTCHRPF